MVVVEHHLVVCVRPLVSVLQGQAGRLVETLHLVAALPLVPDAVHGLGEVDMDPPVVDQDVLHLLIRLLALLVGLELDEGVLQRVVRLVVPNHLTLLDVAEPGKDQLQILGSGPA